MAKRKNFISFNGNYYHDKMIIEEVKKDNVEYFSLNDWLKEFDGKQVQISIVEVGEVTPISDPYGDDE